jgi:SAM-dependent methyltransferase
MTDTFGKVMQAALDGKDASYIIERDDGFIRHTSGYNYIMQYEEWPEAEQRGLQNIEGPLLDVGCGLAKVGEYVKQRGIEYYGVDLSPLAVELCHRRGFENVYLMSAVDIKLDRSDFKTVVLFGNNFGLMGTPEGVVKMLNGFHEFTASDAVVLAGSRDPADTDNEMHLAYHAKNRAEGKPIGQVRLRNVFQGEVDDWWYLLMCGEELMSELAEKAGWYLEHTFVGQRYNVGVLRKH